MHSDYFTSIYWFNNLSRFLYIFNRSRFLMMLGPWLCSTLTHSFRGTTSRNPSSIKAYPKSYPNFQRWEDCNYMAVLGVLFPHYPHIILICMNSMQSVSMHHSSNRVECWALLCMCVYVKRPWKQLITLNICHVFNQDPLCHFVLLLYLLISELWFM